MYLIHCAVIYPYQKLCSMHVTSYNPRFKQRHQNKQSGLLLYGFLANSIAPKCTKIKTTFTWMP